MEDHLSVTADDTLFQMLQDPFAFDGVAFAPLLNDLSSQVESRNNLSIMNTKFHKRYSSVDDLRARPPNEEVVSLDLSYCRNLTSRDIMLLVKMSALRVLQINGCINLTPVFLTALIKHYPMLNKIEMVHLPIEQFLNFHHPKTISCEQVTNLAISGNVPFLHLPYVKELELYNFEDTLQRMECPRLKVLHLWCKNTANVALNTLRSSILPLLMSNRNNLLLRRVFIHLPPSIFKSNAQEYRIIVNRILPRVDFEIVECDDFSRYACHEDIQQSATEELKTLKKLTIPQTQLGLDLLKTFNESNSSLTNSAGIVVTTTSCDIIYRFDNHEVGAHKLVLQCRCPQLLDIEITEAHLQRKHVSKESFILLLQYLYSDALSLPWSNMSSIILGQPYLSDRIHLQLQEVSLLAQKFQVSRLYDIIEVFLHAHNLPSDIVDLITHSLPAQEQQLENSENSGTLSGKGDVSDSHSVTSEKRSSLVEKLISKKIAQIESILETSTLGIDIAKAQSFPTLQDVEIHTTDACTSIKRMRLANDHDSGELVKTPRSSLHSGTGIPASRFLLSSRSSFFSGLFNCGMKESSEKHLSFDTSSYDALRLIVDYVYSNSCQLTPDNVSEVYSLADMMSLLHLQQFCVEYVSAHISDENAILLAKLSYISNADEICEIAFQYFTAHAEVLFQRSEIIDLDWDIFQVFLAHTYNFLIEEQNDEMNSLKVQYQILKAVLRWVKQQCTEDLRDSRAGVDLSLLRRKLNEVLKYINTVRLSPVDFANCLDESGIFDPEIVVSVFAGMGVIVHSEKSKTLKNSLSSAKCEHCHDWGYSRIHSKCSCYDSGHFCYWCNFTGESTKFGPPCEHCLRGEVVRLKLIFDQKLLEECIRIPVEYRQSSNTKRKDHVLNDNSLFLPFKSF